MTHHGYLLTMMLDRMDTLTARFEGMTWFVTAGHLVSLDKYTP